MAAAEPVRWLTGVLGVAPGRSSFWAGLVPTAGDTTWRVEEVADRATGVHLGLHADDPRAVAERARALGASLVEVTGPLVALRSPGGLAFAVAGAPGHAAPEPADHGEHASLLDQVCLDVPEAAYERELAFWSDLLGVPVQGSAYAEFRSLPRTSGRLPLRVLLQRVGHAGPVTAHPDVATDDRPAEVARLVALGAAVEAEHTGWTVLRAPGGQLLCVTGRDPVTGEAPSPPAGPR